MKALIFILMLVIGVLLVIAYSLCVMAQNADERAERMYRKWLEEIHRNSTAKTTPPIVGKGGNNDGYFNDTL